MRFVCVQPANNFFLWQVEVMINNFIEMGVNPNKIDIICASSWIPEPWRTLEEHYPVNFYFYRDTRERVGYLSSIRPNILKQHFKAHPYLEEEIIFYHDCDIIFTKPISQWLTGFESDDICYGSDTRNYINYTYIKSKGYEVIEKMCEIMGLPEELIKENDNNTIGAQYILKGINWQFWERMERDSEDLFTKMTEYNSELIRIEADKWEQEKAEAQSKGEEFNKPKYNPLQIWCADMWALLWGLWREGKKTVIDPRLEFSWCNWSKDDFHRMNIFHNAGVVNDSEGYFYKINYRKRYPDLNLQIKPDSASLEYYNLIKKVAENSVIKKYY